MDDFANSVLHLWELPGRPQARLINVSENCTYLVETDSGARSVLRIHRKGYHGSLAIRSELRWLKALADSRAIDVPAAIAGRNGEFVQSAVQPGEHVPTNLVMFTFIDGSHPDDRGDLITNFRTLGRIAASAHRHATHWKPPNSFFRPAWDLNAIIGPEPRWGNWRDAPNVTAAIRTVLEHAERTLWTRLQRFGAGADRYGLIHADMRLANLIVNDGRIWLIDFDDCGPGWFLYDFAAAVSFMEDHPRVPEYKEAWIEGYCETRNLLSEDVAEIDSFVMLRRLALLAWIGSRIESTEPRKLAGEFASRTEELAEVYLHRHG